MTLSKFMTASLLGAMSFSSGALANRHLSDTATDVDAAGPSGGAPIDTNPLFCSVVAFTHAETIEEARADAVAKTAEYMCGGEGTPTAEEVAKATATGYALAVTSILGQCRPACSGTGSCFGDRAAYFSETELWLQTFADAVTAAAACFQCENFPESWENVSSDVIQAAHFSVDFPAEEVISTNPRTKLIAIYEYYQEVEAAVAAAYAEAVAAAQTADGSAGCYSFEASPECVGQSYSSFNITQIPPLTMAVEEAVALTCSDTPVSGQDAYPTASALAQAIAEALSFVFGSCEADDGSFVCANEDSEVVATAVAIAQEFAHSWSSGLTCKDTCTVDVEFATEAVANVLAEAANDAVGTACASDDTSWTVVGIKNHIETNYLDTISQAILFSIQSNSPGVCIAVTYVSIDTGPTTTST